MTSFLFAELLRHYLLFRCSGFINLFCLATLIMGINSAFVNQYRFAAMESVPPSRAGRAVSLVLVGGIVAGRSGAASRDQACEQCRGREQERRPGEERRIAEGDLSAPPSGHMPKGGYFFDTIIRQEPIDEDRLDPEDNLEEFAPLSEADLAQLIAFLRSLPAQYADFAVKQKGMTSQSEVEAFTQAQLAGVESKAHSSLSSWAAHFLSEIGYLEDLRRSEKDAEAAENRVRNLKDLIATLDNSRGERESPTARLQVFLEERLGGFPVSHALRFGSLPRRAPDACECSPL